jgi:hypothetical protein
MECLGSSESGRSRFHGSKWHNQQQSIKLTDRVRQRRLFRARFPNGASIQRADTDRVFTPAYLVLYEATRVIAPGFRGHFHITA